MPWASVWPTLPQSEKVGGIGVLSIIHNYLYFRHSSNLLNLYRVLPDHFVDRHTADLKLNMSLKKNRIFILVIIGLVFFGFGIQVRPAHAAISLAGINVATLNTSTVTLSTSTTAGELIILEAYTGGGSSGTVIGTPTDNMGDAYTNIFNVIIRGTHNYSVWYAANVPAGVNVVSSTPGIGNNVAYTGYIVAHYKGLSGTPLDVWAATTTQENSPWSSDRVTTNQANELMVGGDYCWGNGGSSCTTATSTGNVTFTGNWTREATTTDTADADQIVYGDQIVSSIQTNASSTGTGGGAGANSPFIATFEAASGGGGSPPPTEYWFNGIIRLIGNFIFH